jgi:hypothetical protein
VFVRYASGVFAAAGAELTERLRAGERAFGTVHVDGEGIASRHTWQIWSNGEIGRMLLQVSPYNGAALAEVLAERGELGAVLAGPEQP